MKFELITGLLTGFLSGIFVTVFLFIVRLGMRPKIKISPVIVERVRKNKETNEENTVWQIKLINKTLFNIENISLDLFIMEDYFHGDAKNYTTKKLNLKIDSFKFIKGKWYKNKELNDNCILVTVSDNITQIWNDRKSWLQFQVVAYHSLSGFRKVSVKKYRDFRDCVIKGEFKGGETFEVRKR